MLDVIMRIFSGAIPNFVEGKRERSICTGM